MMAVINTPDGLPMLSKGSHPGPSNGVCLMEYVSVLAGEPFSDHPTCTHWIPARLARIVNDAISEGARPRLATVAPDLIGLREVDLHTTLEMAGASLLVLRNGVPSSTWLKTWHSAILSLQRRTTPMDHSRWLHAAAWILGRASLYMPVRFTRLAGAARRDELLEKAFVAAIEACGRHRQDTPQPRRSRRGAGVEEPPGQSGGCARSTTLLEEQARWMLAMSWRYG